MAVLPAAISRRTRRSTSAGTSRRSRSAIDLRTWRLRVDGAVDRPLELSMDDLRRLGEDEVVAVNQCSGNSRSLFGPRVAGAQWRNGAMGNARWAGVGLARLLRKAGVRRDAVEVTFDGLDEGPLASVPDFVKSLAIDHALQPEVTVAHSMNGGPLPALNGFPARLVVPGWYATYWVKALHRITVLPHRLRRLLDGQGVQDPGRAQRRRGPACEADHSDRPDPSHERPLVRHLSRGGLAIAGGPGRRGLPGSPSTAAAASGASRSRPMAARPGPGRRSATTWADTRSAAGDIAGPRRRRAITGSGAGPRRATGRRSPKRSAGTGAGT